MKRERSSLGDGGSCARNSILHDRVPWVKSARSGRIIFRWRLLVGYLVVIVATMWVLAGTGLYYWIKIRSGYSDVRYGHVLGLPWTLSAYRQSKGEYWVKEGLAAANEGSWGEAFSHLRLGLPYTPGNQEARMMLARMYLMIGRPDLAQNLLLDGLLHDNAQVEEYLRLVLGFLFGQQADDVVVAVADNLLKNQMLDELPRRMLAIARVYAYYNRDEFERAEQAILRDGLRGAPEGEYVQAKINWAKGLKESALIQLRDVHERSPQDVEIYRTLVHYLREAGRSDEARRVVVSRRLAFPADPDVYLDEIVMLDELQNSDALKAAQSAYVHEFESDLEALSKLSSLAARRGWEDLADFVVKLTARDPKINCLVVLQSIEASVTAKNYESALVRIRIAQELKLPWTAGQRTTMLGLEAVAHYGRGSNVEGQGGVNQILATPNVYGVPLVDLGRHLRMMGEYEVSERLFRRAVELDPLNQLALVELLELQLKSHNIDQSLPMIERLATMRKPPQTLMNRIVKAMESDRYLFLSGRAKAISALNARLMMAGSKIIPSL